MFKRLILTQIEKITDRKEDFKVFDFQFEEGKLKILGLKTDNYSESLVQFTYGEKEEEVKVQSALCNFISNVLVRSSAEVN